MKTGTFTPDPELNRNFEIALDARLRGEYLRGKTEGLQVAQVIRDWLTAQPVLPQKQVREWADTAIAKAKGDARMPDEKVSDLPHLAAFRGWQYLHCPECEHRWKQPSCDVRSLSSKRCPHCDEWCFPYGAQIDTTIPCDDMGNLTVPWAWADEAIANAEQFYEAPMCANTGSLHAVVSRNCAHIREPYPLDEICKQVESNEYNSELMLQHLLLWAAEVESALRDPKQVRAWILNDYFRGEIVLPDGPQSMEGRHPVRSVQVPDLQGD